VCVPEQSIFEQREFVTEEMDLRFVFLTQAPSDGTMNVRSSHAS
jgi:hypothetical protein